MKIVILGPAHPLRGGIAALNERLAQQLQREGDNVEIVSFSLQYPALLFPGKTQTTTDKAPKDLLIRPKMNSINLFNWYKVGKEIAVMKPDMVLVRYWLPFMAPCLGTICRLIRKNKHTKIICIADNILPHEKRPGDTLLTKFMTHSVDAFVAMSKEVYNDIDLFIKSPKKIYAEHPIYDTYGVKLSREEALRLLNLDPKYRYILFFGFIRDYKGLDLLLEAMHEQALKDMPIKLIVAGEYYGNEEKYTALIHQLDLAERVIAYNDYIPSDEINRYFSAADLIVQPYKSATQSGVAQIGYHFNNAMLVTNVGGLHEIIDDKKSGYVVDPHPKAIAEAIVDFYVNHRQEAFEKHCEQLKARFNWDVMTRKIKQLYASLKN